MKHIQFACIATVLACIFLTAQSQTETFMAISTSFIFERLKKSCGSDPAECFEQARKKIFSFFKSGQGEKSSYAACIDINSIKGVLEEGWYIYLNPNLFKNVREFQNYFKRNLFSVSLTGVFNAGKTFLTNKLSKAGLDMGDTTHTSGISLFESDDIVFIDTEGQGNPVSHDSKYILDRRLTDSYILGVAKDVTMLHIHVINRMNNHIQEDLIKAERTAVINDQKLILIHNLRGIKTLEQVASVIERDLVGVFGDKLKKKICPVTQGHFYTSDNILHYIYAEEGSEAGKLYNDKSTEQILIQVAAQKSRIDIINFYDKLISAMQKNLEKFIYNSTQEIVVQSVQTTFVQSIYNLFRGSQKQNTAVIQKSKLKLQMLDVDKSSLLPERFILENKAGLEISERVKNVNGEMTLDLDDKFLPKIKAWKNPQDPYSYILQVELLGTTPYTNITVDAYMVIFEGEKQCVRQQTVSYDIDSTQCGKFYHAVPAPDGLAFRPLPEDNIPLHKLNELSDKMAAISCQDGVCDISLRVKIDRGGGRRQSEDL